jgi:hypothetical protein
MPRAYTRANYKTADFNNLVLFHYSVVRQLKLFYVSSSIGANYKTADFNNLVMIHYSVVRQLKLNCLHVEAQLVTIFAMFRYIEDIHTFGADE